MDEWGRDPSVRQMRKVFSAMEEIDTAWVKGAGISPFDERLRMARDMRRRLYERGCARAVSKGVPLDEALMTTLFRHCHVTAFDRCGLPVPAMEREEDRKTAELIREVAG